jgi:hypothetical protein
MNTIENMNKISKGDIAILGLYDGTAVAFGLSKESYPRFAKAIKDGGRKQLADLLPEFGTKEAVADVLQEQMELMHNKILAISSFVDDGVLERAWGADYVMKKIVWAMNISTLLHLKRIKNDNMYGWLLMDHNSSVAMNDEEGPTITVGGSKATTTAEKMMKKANALMALHKKK